MPFVVFAQEQTESDEQIGAEEITNVARNESALAYASSEKNTLWTPAGSLIDGNYSKDTWQGWEVGYPEVIHGSDNSAGFSGQYFGVKFRNSEYYEIHDIYINLGLHAAMGGQNAHFVVQCLVEGVWITVKEFSDSDTKPLAYDSYEEAMEKDTSYYHIPSEIAFTLDEPVTTNNVRVTLSNYGKNYPGGDVLIFPYVYEIELNGRRGETPDLELPEGAVISTNIGYHSFPEATSSAPYDYPYCAIDGKPTTYWMPRSKAAGESLSLVFNQPKKLNKAVINFGEYLNGMTVIDYAFDIEALVNGDWIKVASGTAFDEANESFITEYTFEEIEAEALRVVFTEDNQKAPTVYEFEAHLSQEQTYYVEDRFNVSERSSASKGNIAIIATPYASHDYVPYSDISYINDGKTDKDAYVWFTGVVDMPAYCGIKFDKKQLIDKVALYFYVPSVEGTDVMNIQVQAKIDGEYVTIVNTKSYHKDLKYSPAFSFDPVETDDIRIVYTTGSGTFAHLKEIEVYSPNGGVPMFNGLPAMESAPKFIEYDPDAIVDDGNSNESSKPNSSNNNTPNNGTGNETNNGTNTEVNNGANGQVNSGTNQNPDPADGGANKTVIIVIVSSVVVVAAAVVVTIVIVKKRKNQ